MSLESECCELRDELSAWFGELPLLVVVPADRSDSAVLLLHWFSKLVELTTTSSAEVCVSADFFPFSSLLVDFGEFEFGFETGDSSTVLFL